MRRSIPIAIALAALALAAPRSGSAEVATAATFYAAYDQHGMGDWNDLMAGVRLPSNDFARSRRGVSLGVSPQLVWGDRFGIAATYERLSPFAEHDARNRTLRLRANALLLSLEYRRRAFRTLRLGVAAGAGYYQLGNEVELTPAGADLEGDGVGYHAFGLGELPFSPSSSARLEVGYRWADVKVDAINRRPPQRGLTPIAVNVDYSGLSVRLGMRIHSHIK